MQIEIKLADATMVESLKELWQKAFGDERAYIDFYFEHRFQEVDTYVCLVENQIVSMATFMPVTYIGKEAVEAKYVYAVATVQKYRNRGYASTLLKQVAEKLQMPLILQPGNPSLISYYEKIGFKKAFEICEVELKCNQCEEIFSQVSGTKQLKPFKEAGMKGIITECDEFTYLNIRDKKLSGPGYVRWDQKGIHYALMENEFCGGKTFKIISEKEEDIFLVRVMNHTLYVLETTLSYERTLIYAWRMIAEYGMSHISKIVALQKINQNEVSCIPGSYRVKTNGMLYDSSMLKEKNECDELVSGYLALTLG